MTRPPNFPPAATVEAFRAIEKSDARLVEGARAACERHGVSGAPVRFASGSLPVFGVGDAHVIKLFPPCHSAEADVEHDGLLAVQGRLPVPTPRLLARGALEGWRHVLMTRLTGRSLAEAWPEIPQDQRERLMQDVGGLVAALHAIDVATVGEGVPRPDWSAFMDAQRARCVAWQAARGVAPEWLEQIPGYLDRSFDERDSLRGPDALLHTEIMREHLLVERDASARWRLSGLFDFEPAMVGDADYECASIGVFVTGGDAILLKRFLAGYGRDPGARMFMTHALLHKYSNLRWYLERVPPPSAVRTLEALANCWWPN